MKKYFEEQLKNLKPIPEDIIDKLNGKSIYSKYKVGDKVCVCLNIQPTKTDVMNISVISIVERDFDKFDEEYIFIRFNEQFPMFIKKGLEKDYIFKGKILL